MEPNYVNLSLIKILGSIPILSTKEIYMLNMLKYDEGQRYIPRSYSCFVICMTVTGVLRFLTYIMLQF